MVMFVLLLALRRTILCYLYLKGWKIFISNKPELIFFHTLMSINFMSLQMWFSCIWTCTIRNITHKWFLKNITRDNVNIILINSDSNHIKVFSIEYSTIFSLKSLWALFFKLHAYFSRFSLLKLKLLGIIINAIVLVYYLKEKTI